MDEINESIGMVDEISAAMSQQIGPVQDEVFLYFFMYNLFYSLN